jgi:phospholipase/carboxylesterase
MPRTASAVKRRAVEGYGARVITCEPTLAARETTAAEELRRWGLTDRDLVLAGFSQGSMLALHLGLRRKTPPAGILAFSGALAAGKSLKQEMTAKPPVMLIHGDRDEVLPVGLSLMAAQDLAAAGHGAQFHISGGIPHSIGPDGMELGGRFLKACFEGRYASVQAE